jgi:DNA polymerase-1
MKLVIFDAETNGLLDELDRVHVLVLRVFNGENSGVQVFRRNQVEDSIAQGLETLMQMAAEGYTCIGHNVIKFDVPAYKKVYPWFSLPKDRVLDTIILSRLIYPDTGLQDAVLLRRGQLPKKYFKKHSLEAWGYRLGNRKDDYEGDPQIEDEEQRKREKWSRWNQTMEDYCVQDTSTNESLYSFLMAKNPSAESMRLEHDVQWIVCRQIARGVCFDKAAAAKLYADLSQKREELTRALREVFPPFVVNNGKPFIPKRDDKKRGYKAGFPVQKKKTVEFNPGSREHVALMLTRRYGWEPEEFTDDGKPKIDDAVLKKLKYPEAALLADYYMVVKRIGQVAEGDEAWLKRVKPNGRIHGDVTTNGAVTGRMTHSKPNLAQCPKVKLIAGAIALGLEGEYGFECRSCFIAGVGFVIVGADGAALELRDLAGYMAKWDGGAYIKVVLEGRKEDGTEIHTVNQKALEIDSRDDAKTWFYAFLYGAGDEKLGTIVTKVRGKASAKKGKELREKFMRNLPALGALVKAVKAAAKERGFLFGLDGRKLHVRSQHSALNTLLQSAGAIQMKKALVILDEMLQQKGLKPGIDYEFVLNVHDEWQIETRKEIADEVGRTAVAAIRAAGEYFKFPCPLDGEYKVGRTWAETH